MKIKAIIISLIIIILLTASALFLKIIPCKSWYGSNTGVEDSMPHNTFCNIFYGVGPHNEYYYFTTNPTIALIITFAIFLIIVFAVKFFLLKIKKSKKTKK